MPKKKTPAKSATTTNPQPPADTPALPPSTQAVLSQLDTENGMTAAEVAESSGLGRSTVTKALSTLHEAGLAVRQDGGHEGSRPIAARWFAAPGTTEALAADDGTEDHTPEPSREAADDGGAATAAQQVPDGAEDRDDEPAPAEEYAAGNDAADSSPDEPTPNTAPDDETELTMPAAAPALGGPGPESGQANNELSDITEHDDQPMPPAAEAGSDPGGDTEAQGAATVAEAEPGAVRLGKGELRAQVEAHLRENPDQTWTPTAISKILNRSAGAINNACVKLSEDETVRAFTDKPVRFQWNGADGTDAS